MNSRKMTYRRPESGSRTIARCAWAGIGNVNVPTRPQTTMSLRMQKMKHFEKTSKNYVSASAKSRRMCETRYASKENDLMKSKNKQSKN